jgi:hypothetical protein
MPPPDLSGQCRSVGNGGRPPQSRPTNLPSGLGGSLVSRVRACVYCPEAVGPRSPPSVSWRPSAGLIPSPFPHRRL